MKDDAIRAALREYLATPGRRERIHELIEELAPADQAPDLFSMALASVNRDRMAPPTSAPTIDPQRTLDERVRAVAASERLSYADALRAVSRAEPSLYERARADALQL
jgi:Arc/MetJ-type ribon-helix-helix transcriptional regulator